MHPAAYDQTRPLCLMHVPKAAGTSLAASLAVALSPTQVSGGFDRVLFGDFAGFAGFAPAERQQIFQTPSALPREAGLIAGHFSYATLRAAYPTGQLVTVLRDPFTRLMSLWLFWRRHTDAHLAGLGGWADSVRLARLPLAVFLSHPRIAAQTDNVALRMLVWPHVLAPSSAFIDPTHDRQILEAAQARLAEFAFTGVAEDPDLWNRLSAWLRRPLATERRNGSEAVPAGLQTPFADELDEDCLSLLQARSRLDLHLWDTLASAHIQAPQIVLQRTRLRDVARYGALMATAGRQPRDGVARESGGTEQAVPF